MELNRKSKVILETEPVVVTKEEEVERSENFVPLAHFLKLEQRQAALQISTSNLADFGGVQEKSAEKNEAVSADPSPNVTSAMMKNQLSKINESLA